MGDQTKIQVIQVEAKVNTRWIPCISTNFKYFSMFYL